MALENFEWLVDIGTDGDYALNGTELRFGDGYGALVGDGIRPITQLWNVQMTGSWDDTTTDGNKARAFLLRHTNRIPFKWQNPDGNWITVRMTSYREASIGASLFRFTAVFKEFPEATDG